jgi:hypothetical protein
MLAFLVILKRDIKAAIPKRFIKTFSEVELIE